ncbi:unnamed protein product [Leptidea sinapis]|uniref:Uncharacterized protein n=1 Tax=Leptidea sinapis TaxID=189913 RepID=A0A5E4QMR6_9NEOP|nr:unnamed protein product [Leptidea sinapis]
MSFDDIMPSIKENTVRKTVYLQTSLGRADGGLSSAGTQLNTGRGPSECTVTATVSHDPRTPARVAASGNTVFFPCHNSVGFLSRSRRNRDPRRNESRPRGVHGSFIPHVAAHKSTESRSWRGARGEGGVAGRAWNLPGSEASADSAASACGMRRMILPDVMRRPKPSWCAKA